MPNLPSPPDLTFLADFSAGRVPASAFDHRAHVRLAWILLTQHETDVAHERMRDLTLGFLRTIGVTPSKYHETITRAWMLAVRHFMEGSEDCDSSEAFVERNPRLLDAGIMLSHYSAEVLFSEEGRGRFLEPDIAEIPRHVDRTRPTPGSRRMP